jgi:TolB-like protein
MAVNDKQKIAVLPINAQTETTINNYLALGYVIQFVVNLNPAVNSLLIVYSTPEVI